MTPKVLLNKDELALTIDRLCHQLIENHDNFKETVLIGVQPRGIYFAERLRERLIFFNKNLSINYGRLDPTFYRDDIRRRNKPLTAYETTINFSIENKNVVLIDDVLYTARTIRSALDALLDYGRPKNVELLTLVVRRFSKQLPIEADYIGLMVDAIETQQVKVEWKNNDGQDRILLIKDDKVY